MEIGDLQEGRAVGKGTRNANEAELIRREAFDGEPCWLDRLGQQGDIGLAADKVLAQRRAQTADQPKPHLREGPTALFDERRRQHLCIGILQADRDRSVDTMVLGEQVMPGLLEVAQPELGALEQELALLGRRGAASVTLEQLHAEFCNSSSAIWRLSAG